LMMVVSFILLKMTTTFQRRPKTLTLRPEHGAARRAAAARRRPLHAAKHPTLTI
jgi:hypothetical protein